MASQGQTGLVATRGATARPVSTASAPPGQIAALEAGARASAEEAAPLDLEMPRAKARSLAAGATYRLLRLLARVVGRERALKVGLGASRVFSRFSFELAGEWYGPTFHCATMALSEEVLRAWIPKGGTVLDVGCGIGRWSRIAAERAGQVLGVDLDRHNIELARSMTGAPNVSFRLGDVTRDLEDQRFDVALAIHLLEHIDDPVRLLRSLRDRASSLIVEVPDFESDPLNHVRRELRLPFYSDADHVREYTIEGLRAQLASSGWRPRHEAKRGGAILVVAVHDAAPAAGQRQPYKSAPGSSGDP